MIIGEIKDEGSRKTRKPGKYMIELNLYEIDEDDEFCGYDVLMEVTRGDFKTKEHATSVFTALENRLFSPSVSIPPLKKNQ